MAKKTTTLLASLEAFISKIDVDKLESLKNKFAEHAESIEEKEEQNAREEAFVPLAEKVENLYDLLQEIAGEVNDAKEAENGENE